MYVSDSHVKRNPHALVLAYIDACYCNSNEAALRDIFTRDVKKTDDTDKKREPVKGIEQVLEVYRKLIAENREDTDVIKTKIKIKENSASLRLNVQKLNSSTQTCSISKIKLQFYCKDEDKMLKIYKIVTSFDLIVKTPIDPVSDDELL